MKQHLLKEIEVGTKNALLKKKIITHYIYNGSSTITDLAKELDLSVPTVTKFISEMCEEGYINVTANWKRVEGAILAYTA
jgi:Mn-dependent DtxR family transcriptional regulator